MDIGLQQAYGGRGILFPGRKEEQKGGNGKKRKRMHVSEVEAEAEKGKGRIGFFSSS